MKDKTITIAHFEYVNEQIKILGFKNLADFETKISYPILKQEQKYICEQINLTIEWFKKLFPQEGFDLRKINYSFENIDQVLGFIKKLFSYLSIKYDYSRIKGIPTLRLIQPNNLYSNYIMNLRNIPQKEIFSSLNKIDIEQKKNTLSSSNNLVANNNFKHTNQIRTEEKNYPILSITEIFNKFQKKEISKKITADDKVNLSLIPIDWINTINVSIVKPNTKKIPFGYEALPLGTNICLIIGDDEIILYSVNDDKNNKFKINIPNNFLYKNTTVFLKINLPNEKINEIIDNLTCDFNFQYEFDGWEITNKNIVSEFVNMIILFNDDALYSNFSCGIYNHDLKLKIKNYYDTINNQISYGKFGSESFYSYFPIDSDKPSNVKMSYLMGYLKKPFEKKYIINNKLCLSNLINFDYFYWIKIKNFDNSKLCVGTKIKLKIGDNIELIKEITNNDIFDIDQENYYKYEIDFPNSVLFKNLDIQLGIKLGNDKLDKNIYDNDSDDDDDDDNYGYNQFDIIINGSCFKVSTPQIFFNTNTVISYEHNSKWFIPDEKEFISVGGYIHNKHANLSSMTEDELVGIYKKLKKQNLLSINKIELDSGFTDTCIFADADLEIFRKKKSQLQKNIDGLYFLISGQIKRYFDENNILIKNTDSESFSFGSNKFIGLTNYEICELTNMSTYKMYLKIFKESDIIKHIDLEFKNLKLNNNNKYEFNAWIEHDSKIIYDFGKKNFNKKIRLSCEKKYVSMLNLLNVTFLVIEIPCDKLNDWKNISMSIGQIYSDRTMRMNIAQSGSPTVNVLDK